MTLFSSRTRAGVVTLKSTMGSLAPFRIHGS